MNNMMIVEIFYSFNDLTCVVDDGWFVVFEGTPLLTKQFRKASCEGEGGRGREREATRFE